MKLELRSAHATLEEHAAAQALLDEHGENGHGSVTRELPGEQGPLLVDAGGRRFRVHLDGTHEELDG